MKKRLLSVILAMVMVLSLLPVSSVTAASNLTGPYIQSEVSFNEELFKATRTDFRDESVYTLLITRFNDGDSSNNIHCWDDGWASNPDSDPAWRGDFQGLIEKLDYIKALGFTAVQLNPVSQNASGYDYHGEHPIDMKKVDFRYESEGYTYQDLIDACHAREMKVMQNVTLNHTSNFGEEFLCKMFDINPEEFSDITTALSAANLLLEKYPDYLELSPAEQFPARMDVLKGFVNANNNENEHYHRETSMDYYSSLIQQGQIAGDCVDINTENPAVAAYLAEVCELYARMFVDAICILDAVHINRWTLNEGILPLLQQKLEEDGLDMEIFYEVVSRVRETWNYNTPSMSVPFYSWAETESAWMNNWDSTHPTANIQMSIDHFDAHNDPSACPTSSNAFLDGITYHAPDYSQSSGMHAVDFGMMHSFENAQSAFDFGRQGDTYMNDATWNLLRVDSIDYGPDGMEKTRYSMGTQSWAENLNLLFTFRGIPSILYGTEIEFQKDCVLDLGPNAPLSTTGRAYFGDNLEGTVTTDGFTQYTASGTVADTLSSPLAKHIRQLNAVRMSVPALRKGQYTVDSNYVSGNKAYIKRYTDAEAGIDSLVLVAVSEGATFKNIPNGKYVDAFSGDTQTVTNGTLSTGTIARGDLVAYVCEAPGFTGLQSSVTAADADATVTLDWNDGSGETSALEVNSIGYGALPEGTPNGETVKSWSVNGVKYQPGTMVKFAEDSVATAIYEESDTPVQTYSVAIASTANGEVTADRETALAGETITLTVTPSEGYELDTLTVTDASGDPVVLTDNSFTMPASDVTVAATFKEKTTVPDVPDVPESFNRVYFKNTDNWDGVNAYAWNASQGALLGAWPGSAMTKLADDIYYIDVPEGAENIIFNGGSAQTLDLDFPTDNKNLYNYSAGEWICYTHQYENGVCTVCGAGCAHNFVNGSCENCKAEIQVSIPGSFNGWNTSSWIMTRHEDGTYTYQTDLDTDTYTFKIMDDGNWLGNSGTIEDHTSGYEWIFADGPDCTLSASGGTYTFIYNINTKGLKVEFETDHVHDYDAAFNWADYYTVCTVDLVCGCGVSTTKNCVISKTLDNGKLTFTASSADHSDTVTVDADNSNTIYVDISAVNWNGVNAYCWNDAGEVVATWPGTAMTHVSGSVYAVTVPDGYGNIIFNSNGSQTSDLKMPVKGENIAVVKGGNANWGYMAPPTCTITWIVDGVSQTTTVAWGELPTFTGITDKAPNGCTVYTFDGWDKEIVAATEDTTYTATYTESIRHLEGLSYQVNDDGTHSLRYACCNTVTETAPHNTDNLLSSTPGDCKTPALYTYSCSCGYTYQVTGERNPDRHVTSQILYRNNDDGTHTSYHPCCKTDIATEDHTYTNGICACGAEEKSFVAADLKFAGASLTLEDDLTINFKAKRELLEAGGYSDPYAVIVMNGKETVIRDYTLENGRYVFAFKNVSPNRMGDTVTATLYATKDGEVYESAPITYSAATYCYNMLAKCSDDSYAKLRTLLVDLLNYGAASQLYVSYNTENLVNAALTEEQKGWATATDRELTSVLDQEYATILNPTVQWKGAGLVLQESIVMRFKFKAESVENLSVKIVNGTESIITDFEETDDGYFLFCDKLHAAQMSEPVYVTVYDGDTVVSNTVRYSIESYAASKITSEDTTLVNLLKAMMKYGDTAVAYKN